jgi:membrane protein
MNEESRPSRLGQLLAIPRQLLDSADRMQQRSRVIGIAVATWKKFSDDQAGNLAALIAYYAFFSLFPLLLVGVTVLDLVSRNDPHLHNQLLAALGRYPVIGPQLEKHAHGLRGTGIALVIGSALTLFGARGVAVAMQNATNSVWEVPQFRRPRFPWSLLRSFGIMGVIGPGIIATTSLSVYAGAGVSHIGGAFGRVVATAVALLLNFGLFWLGFRFAASNEIAWRDLRLSAILAAVVWQVLQLVGGYVIGHYLRTTSAYGVFGVVLGLLTWFYVQAQVTLYAVELNVVRVRKLWPRSLNPPPLTDADWRCYQLYADAGQRRPEVEIEVLPPSDGGQQTGSDPRQ